MNCRLSFNLKLSEQDKVSLLTCYKLKEFLQRSFGLSQTKWSIEKSGRRLPKLSSTWQFKKDEDLSFLSSQTNQGTSWHVGKMLQELQKQLVELIGHCTWWWWHPQSTLWELNTRAPFGCWTECHGFFLRKKYGVWWRQRKMWPIVKCFEIAHQMGWGYQWGKDGKNHTLIGPVGSHYSQEGQYQQIGC